MGYTIATINELSISGNVIRVLQHGALKVTTHEFQKDHSLDFYDVGSLTFAELKDLCFKFEPDLVVISGWMSLNYLRIARLFIKSNVNVVCALDSQWKSTYKKFLIMILFKLGFQNYFYNYYWIPGYKQFHFLTKIGVSVDKIIFDLYSADTQLFKLNSPLSNKKYGNLRKFLFVGRLESSKGIDNLISVAENILKYRSDFILTIVGDGSLKNSLPASNKNIIYKNFLPPKDLAVEFGNHDFFVLPSIYEPWGVVIHEAVSMGLPILASKNVGSASEFVIDGHNGYTFDPTDLKQIENFFNILIDLPINTINSYSINSLELSKRISPKSSSANLLSIFSKIL